MQDKVGQDSQPENAGLKKGKVSGVATAERSKMDMLYREKVPSILAKYR